MTDDETAGEPPDVPPPDAPPPEPAPVDEPPPDAAPGDAAPGDDHAITPLTTPLAAPPPPTIGAAESIGYGCGGFIAFFLGAALLGGIGAATSFWVAGVLAVLAIVGLVQSVRSATPSGRARFARVAVGFAAAAIVFGGCIALLSNTNFH